ncbi:MAG: thioredoxin domain-containing protein, partial [Dehalococcoidia bacterium]
GGIYDQLGGGFARYATDSAWLVPHFEKMLYDNALLSMAYLQAFQATGDKSYRRIVEETLGYLLRDLRHPTGGFFSSQDADSEGEEGKFYVWSDKEFAEVLGPSADLLRGYYGVTPEGNFEGQNILNVTTELKGVAAELGISPRSAAKRLSDGRRLLHEVRARRVPPATDDKVLTAWNGLALRALAEAGAVLERVDFVSAAEECATFLLSEMRPRQRLLRSWKDGRANLNAYLEDYALLINGLLSLHQATFSHRWLHAADELTGEMIALFWDDEAGGFYDVGSDHERLLIRPRSNFDNAVPSGASAAAEALLRLSVLSGNEEYREKAATLLASNALLAGQHPQAFGNWLRVMEMYLSEPSEVALLGDPADDATKAMMRAVHGRYLPNLTVIGLDPSESLPFASPLLTQRGQVGGRATAYVCSNYVCALPTADPKELASQLRPS